MFRKPLGGNVICGASQDSRAVLAHQSCYAACLAYLPLLVKQHNPQELSLFKIKCQETSVLIRVPLEHLIHGPAFG